MNSDVNHSRTVESDITQFHLDLLNAVLVGFVDVTAGIQAALEGIFQSLTTTVSQSQGSNDTKFIVCQRCELDPTTNVIRSCKTSTIPFSSPLFLSWKTSLS